MKRIEIDRNHPFRKKSTQELLNIISHNASLEIALGDNPSKDKLVIQLKETREAAEAVLQGRNVDVPNC